MAQVKISELTAKGSALQGTDLLEISQLVGSAYVSKSVNGGDIIDAAQSGMQSELISGTNIKTINSSSILGSGDLSVGTVTSVGLTTDALGTDVSVSGSPITGSGSITLSIPTASALNTGKLSKTDWTTFNNKQDALVSGTNIKTINSTSLLGSGNIAVQPTLVSGTNIKTINGNSLLGSGDLVISTGLTIGTTAITSGTIGRILFEGTGNVLQESANLFWDNTNGRLGIGTSSPSATLHSVGSITASGAIAIGNYMQPTLVAAANNDVTVGLDITPTFTNGAFTGVTNYGIRSSINYAGEYNGILIRNTNSTAGVGVSRFGLGNNANTLLCGLNAFSSVYGSYLNNSSVLCTFPTSDLILATNFNQANSGTSSIRFFTGGYTSGQQRMQIFSTGNIAINTTTDAGYKLDVNGTSRFSGLMLIANGLQFGQTGAESYLNTSGTTAIQINRKNITLSNGADNQLTIEAGNGGGSIAKIWLGGFSGTQPLCFNGNGRESVFGLDTATPSTSALIRMESTTKGFLPPRMTTAQKNSISSPAAGLMVYDTTLNKLCVYTTAWETITSI